MLDHILWGFKNVCNNFTHLKCYVLNVSNKDRLILC